MAPIKKTTVNFSLGERFLTTKSTILKEPDSMLARMFCGDLNPSIKDDQGYFLVDRDPKYFQPILNYLRTGKFNLDANLSRKAVLEEAHYFGIQSLRNLSTPDQNGTSLAMLLTNSGKET